MTELTLFDETFDINNDLYRSIIREIDRNIMICVMDSLKTSCFTIRFATEDRTVYTTVFTEKFYFRYMTGTDRKHQYLNLLVITLPTETLWYLKNFCPGINQFNFTWKQFKARPSSSEVNYFDYYDSQNHYISKDHIFRKIPDPSVFKIEREQQQKKFSELERQLTEAQKQIETLKKEVDRQVFEKNQLSQYLHNNESEINQYQMEKYHLDKESNLKIQEIMNMNLLLQRERYAIQQQNRTLATKYDMMKKEIQDLLELKNYYKQKYMELKN